mmetsp:Transcript_37465/g.85170  ORF Transcript_37465/g.85170 Transcript_37465/m.85170 type:complete len:159 (-) Transcript_37465:107-583(-)
MCPRHEWDASICEVSQVSELAQAVELYYMLPQEEMDLSAIAPRIKAGEKVTVEKCRMAVFNRAALGSLRTRISDLDGRMHLLEFDRRDQASGAWVYRSEDDSATARVSYEKTGDATVINGSFTVPGKNSALSSTYMICSGKGEFKNCSAILKIAESKR